MNKKQIAFRVPEDVQKKFYAALKGQGLDIADVLVPRVMQFISQTESGTQSQAGLQGNPKISTAASGVTPISEGATLSKPLLELVPMLERLLASGAANRSALRVVIDSMYAHGGFSEELPLAANHSGETSKGRKPRGRRH